LVIAIGLFQVTFYFGLQYVGLGYTTAANTSLIVNTRPILAALLSALWLREAIGLRRALGILLAFAGVVFVVLSGAAGAAGLASQRLLGDSLIVLNALSGALAIVLLKSMLGHYSPMATAVYTTAAGTAGLLPLAAYELFRGGWPAGSALSWAAVVFMGVANTAIPYLLWYNALARLKASETAVFLYVTPIISVVLSAALLGEALSLWLLIGGIMVLIGAYWTVAAGQSEQSTLLTK